MVAQLAATIAQIQAENKKLKNTVAEGQFELAELRTNLASFRCSLCTKLYCLYKAVGKEDLYHASSS